MLTPAEQTLFRRLAVFAGGCTVEAADAVCERVGRLEITTLAGLASLVDKSLLSALGEGDDEVGPRFGMLETVREFALAQLLAGSDAEAAHREHARYYLSLAEHAERELNGPAQEAWLNRLETEHQNFRAALRFAKHAGDVELGLRLVAALGPFWTARGHLEEAQTWLDTFLESAESIDIPDTVRARALCAGASVFALLCGHNERSLSTLREALELAQRAGDDATAAVMLWQLGTDYSATADFRRGQELLAESLTLFQRLGDQSGICAVLMGLATPPRFQGDFERATAIFGEALSVARELGHSRRIAEILAKLGSLESERGRPECSAPFYEEARGIYRRLGDPFGIADILLRSGETAVDMGEFEDALDLLEASLPIFQSQGSSIAVAHVRLYQGEAALRMGDLGRAEELASQSLEVLIGFGDCRFTCDARLVLADVAREQHNLERALTLYKTSLSALRNLNARPLMAQCLERMVLFAALRELAGPAARLHGAAQALRAGMGAEIPPADRERYNHALADVREQMGKEAFDAAVGEGKAMTLDQAVDYALDEVTAGSD